MCTLLFKLRDAFIDYWFNDNKITMDTACQIFEILRKPGYSFLTQVSISFLFLVLVGMYI